MTAFKEATERIELLIEAAKLVQHERAVGDRLTKITEVIDHPVEALAVVCNGQITLDKSSKASVEMQGVHLHVPEEVSLDGQPSGSRRPWRF